MGLAEATQRLRARNDALAEELRRDRGSLPPSSPMPIAPVMLTAERAAEIAHLLTHSLAVMTAATLIGLTAGEFVAFCKRGAK